MIIKPLEKSNKQPLSDFESGNRAWFEKTFPDIIDSLLCCRRVL